MSVRCRSFGGLGHAEISLLDKDASFGSTAAGSVVGAEASEEEEEVEVVEDDMSLGLGMHKYPCFTKTQ
jgi:hypothetical protein